MTSSKLSSGSPMPMRTMWRCAPECPSGRYRSPEQISPARLRTRPAWVEAQSGSPSGSHLRGDADRVAVMVAHDNGLPMQLPSAICSRYFTVPSLASCRRSILGQQCKAALPALPSRSRLVDHRKLGDQLPGAQWKICFARKPGLTHGFQRNGQLGSVREEIQRFCSMVFSYESIRTDGGFIAFLHGAEEKPSIPVRVGTESARAPPLSFRQGTPQRAGPPDLGGGHKCRHLLLVLSGVDGTGGVDQPPAAFSRAAAVSRMDDWVANNSSWRAFSSVL